MFEKASRKRLRFQLSNGIVTTEDLWSLSLESLNNLAIYLHRQIKESDDISFISDEASIDELILLRFQIIKHIIDIKLAEKSLAKDKAEKDATRVKLLQLIDNKKDEALTDLSIDELLDKVNKL